MGVHGFDSIAEGKLQAELLTPKTDNHIFINANTNTAPTVNLAGASAAPVAAAAN